MILYNDEKTTYDKKNTTFAAMNVWLNRILLTIVSLSFFISASEIDLGPVHNTFFDEFDTYQKADDISVSYLDECQTPDSKGVLLQTQAIFPGTLIEVNNSCIFPGVSSKEIKNPDKLFILHSVWRI